MKLKVAGKRVVITGASSGLGAHFARLLYANGAHIGLLARRVNKLSELANSLKRPDGGNIALAECDILDEDAIANALAKIHSKLGGIDVLINNAGVTYQSPALDQTTDDFDAVMNTNLRGAWITSVKTANLMVADGISGSIINIGSILGERVARNVASYAVSKAAISQLTKALGLEWARYGIRVNALAPGYLRTELNDDFFASKAGSDLINRVPQRRLGLLSELDGPLMLLASDASSFMTGAVIPVDGGHLVSSL